MTAERRPRHTKSSMTYRPPYDIEKRIDKLVESEEFANRADAMTALLRSGLDHRKFNIELALEEFLNTERGIAMVQQAARRKTRTPKK